MSKYSKILGRGAGGKMFEYLKKGPLWYEIQGPLWYEIDVE